MLRRRQAHACPAAPHALLAFPLALNLGCATSAAATVVSDPVAPLRERILGASADRVESFEIGNSREGRPIVALRAGAADRPALLLVGGVDGRLVATPEVALSALRGVLDDPTNPLAEATLYVVPCLDPDGFVRAQATPTARGVPRPVDDDRDGLVDEDPMADVDGDGQIAWMRVFDPAPPLAKTHLVDPADSRRNKLADRAKGEVARFAVVREARDLDRDGRAGEDGLGFVDLNRNFPHQFDEHGEGAGPWALSEPETRALADWMLARADIEAVLVLGDGDSLFDLPEAGKYDATQRAPLGLERGDLPFAEELQKQCQAVVQWPKTRRAPIEGAFHSWAYAQYGVFAFALDLTRHPSRDATHAAASAPATEGAAEPEKPATDKAEKKGGGKSGDDGEIALLDAAAAEGRGFVAWHEFAHPELGRVEIGGMSVGFDLAPPAAVWPGLGADVAKVAAVFLARLPRAEIGTPRVESLGGGVYRIRLPITNRGSMPIPSAIGEKVGRRGPIAVRLELPRDRVPSGRLVQTMRTLEASGGEGMAEWLVIGAEGETVAVTVRAPRIGMQRLEVKLTANGGAR